MLKSSQMWVIKNLIDVIPLLYCQYFCQKLIAKVEFITSFIREKKSKEFGHLIDVILSSVKKIILR